MRVQVVVAVTFPISIVPVFLDDFKQIQLRQQHILIPYLKINEQTMVAGTPVGFAVAS